MARQSYNWTLVNDAAPFAPRDGAGAVVYKDRMWFIGGWNPGDSDHFPRICNNEVWSSEDGADWDLVRPNTFLDDTFDPSSDWEGRHTAGYVVFHDRMWIVGGDVNQGHYQNDVWSSETGVDWRRHTGSVPWVPRALHHTVAWDGYIWVMGGQTVPQLAAGPASYYDDVWRSSDGTSWEQISVQEPRLPQRGMIGGSAVHRGALWILGGGTYDTPDIPTRQFFNDVWSTVDGQRWVCHAQSTPWAPRQYHEVAVFDDRLWVLEGYSSDGNRNDVWYSEDGIQWFEVPETPWAPRHAASVFVFQDALWMVAGNNMTSDVWKLSRA